ncbi:MAG: c-type cytochrome [Steroidobacteraceae bacterium]
MLKTLQLSTAIATLLTLSGNAAAQALKQCESEIPAFQQVQAYPERTTDPAAVERGSALYQLNGCAFCHGKDTRGGDGGPSLLRSQLVLRDQKGELISDIVTKGVPGTAMAAFSLSKEQMADIAEFLHSFSISSRDPARMRPAEFVTGNANAGKRFFGENCASCHSVTGDLKGIGAKYTEARPLQQRWLMPASGTCSRASVTTTTGTATGDLLRIDEFTLTIRLPDGAQRTFTRKGDSPKVEIMDPLVGHKALLPKYTDKNIHDVTAYLVTVK